MKRLSPIFFLLLFVFTACVQEPPKEKKIRRKSRLQKTDTSQTKTKNEASKKSKTYVYYAGAIGLYGEDVLLEICQDDLKLHGRYWYLKHGKPIQLSGKAAPKSGEWQLTEEIKNVVTGFMDLEVKDGQISGNWYAPENVSELQDVSLKKIYTSTNGRIQPKFEEYTKTKTITLFDGEEDVEEEATDDIRLVQLGDYVLFQYFVIGTNAHVGHINGLATIKNQNEAIFTGEEGCELSLSFEKDAITIEEVSECSYYRGARAHFDATLTKSL